MPGRLPKAGGAWWTSAAALPSCWPVRTERPWPPIPPGWARCAWRKPWAEICAQAHAGPCPPGPGPRLGRRSLLPRGGLGRGVGAPLPPWPPWIWPWSLTTRTRSKAIPDPSGSAGPIPAPVRPGPGPAPGPARTGSRPGRHHSLRRGHFAFLLPSQRHGPAPGQRPRQFAGLRPPLSTARALGIHFCLCKAAPSFRRERGFRYVPQEALFRQVCLRPRERSGAYRPLA